MGFMAVCVIYLMRLLQPCVCYVVPLWRMSVNYLKHSGSVLIWGIFPAFVWRDWGK